MECLGGAKWRLRGARGLWLRLALVVPLNGALQFDVCASGTMRAATFAMSLRRYKTTLRIE